MKASELRDMSVEELQTKLTELKEELFNLVSSLLLISSKTHPESVLLKRTSQEFQQFFVRWNLTALKLKRGGLNSE